MNNQLSEQPLIPETGIINLDDNNGPGTHLVAYAIHPKTICFFKYVSELKSPVWYSTLNTQKLTDPPICGRETVNVLMTISETS